MRYSTARGKLCPGGAKIKQVPGILAAALALLDGTEDGTAQGAAPGASPAPTTASSGGTSTATPLAVDGRLGPATIRRWQEIMSTPVDGVISRRSQLVIAVQRRLVARGHSIGSAGVDGKLGPATIRALQAHLGTPVDGVVSTPSPMVKPLQPSSQHRHLLERRRCHRHHTPTPRPRSPLPRRAGASRRSSTHHSSRVRFCGVKFVDHAVREDSEFVTRQSALMRSPRSMHARSAPEAAAPTPPACRPGGPGVSQARGVPCHASVTAPW
jgi:hypothetical protein